MSHFDYARQYLRNDTVFMVPFFYLVKEEDEEYYYDYDYDYYYCYHHHCIVHCSCARLKSFPHL